MRGPIGRKRGTPRSDAASLAPRPDDEGGFILGLVVLMLFAIAVAGAAGYQMVNTEFTLSTQSRDGQKALVVARAGLSRFLGETIGVVGDDVSYAIGDGIATITTRKVLEQDSLNHLYYIRSSGAVADLRTPNDPSTRVVGTYAWHRMNPIPLKAAIFMTDRNLRVRDNGAVSGFDYATTSDCPGGGTAGVYGVSSGGNISTSGSGTIVGNPTGSDESYTGYSDVYADMAIRWDILSNPNFPVEFDGTVPNWFTLPSDSFPIVRYQGNLTGYSWSAQSGGRGVLIVTGRFTPSWYFSWYGIILAGNLNGNSTYHYPYIEGMMLVGMDGTQNNEDLRSGTFRYHSCNVYGANKALSYLEVVDNAVFELN